MIDTVNVNKCNPGETPVEDRGLLNFKEREKERETEREIFIHLNFIYNVSY